MRVRSSINSGWLALLSWLLLTEVFGQAATIRMDNRPGWPSDFPDLGTAVNKAKAGDTIYIAGSPDWYGVGKEIIIDKQLTLIGPGYGIPINYPESRGNQHDAIVENIRIDETGAGTELTGLIIPTLHCNGDETLVKRCSLRRCIFGDKRLVSRPRLFQCLVLFDRWGSSLALHARDAVVSSNLIIQLEFLGNEFFSVTDIGSANTQPASAHYSQNTIVGGFTRRHHAATRFTFSNNIIYLDRGQSAVDYFVTQFSPDTATNLIAPISTERNEETFLMEGPFDARYQLGIVAENPARGRGEFGEDLGAFGGPTPYVLSGIPSLPYFEVFAAQSSVGPSGKLKVRLKAVGGE